MKKIKYFLFALSFVSLLSNCKNENKETAVKAEVRDSNKRYVLEPGDVPMAPEEENSFRPTLPLDQAGFKGAGKEEERLKNEFEFMFDKKWTINGRVKAGDDKPQENKHETYTFNRDGSYDRTIMGTGSKGTWKGWMDGQFPVITIFPIDLEEKVTEWNVKNTGKTMIWSGTSSYKDNAFMMQFVIK